MTTSQAVEDRAPPPQSKLWLVFCISDCHRLLIPRVLLMAIDVFFLLMVPRGRILAFFCWRQDFGILLRETPLVFFCHCIGYNHFKTKNLSKIQFPYCLTDLFFWSSQFYCLSSFFSVTPRNWYPARVQTAPEFLAQGLLRFRKTFLSA